jgi:hypothetical protein
LSDPIEAGLGTNPNPYFPNGTAPYSLCSDTSAANDETAPYAPYSVAAPLIPNSWPPDFNDNYIVNGADMGTFSPYYNTAQPSGTPGSRWDFNVNGIVNGQDVAIAGNFYNKSCNLLYPTAPTPTVSRYMRSINTGYSQGCADGTAGRGGTVILDWGHPSYDAGQGYGTQDYSATYRSWGQILAAADDYIYGFWHCTPVGGPHIAVVIGADNDFLTSSYSSHGVAWGQLIDGVNYYIDTSGFRSQVDAIGGIDAEGSFDSASNTLTWGSAYLATSSSTYYDFGSLDGCLTDWNGNVTTFGSHLCASPDWTEENFAQIAWKLDSEAFPYPEMYRRDGYLAAQWQALSVYTYATSAGVMDIRGTLTQVGACDYKASIGYPDDFCTKRFTDNSSSNAWHQMWWLTNRDSLTQGSVEASTSDITYY